ncbi:MAG: hypothetical protein ACPF8V_00370 [Luteibaculum sp.]
MKFFKLAAFVLVSISFCQPANATQPQKDYGDRTETVIFEEKEVASPLEQEEVINPIEFYQNEKPRIDFDDSELDRRFGKKKDDDDSFKNNPPDEIPISDHLEWLFLGGILLFVIAFKKQLFPG